MYMGNVFIVIVVNIGNEFILIGSKIFLGNCFGLIICIFVMLYDCIIC